MKQESKLYRWASKQRQVEPRLVVAISFDDADTDITYLSSHTDALVPTGTATIDRIDGVIKQLSGQSQKIDSATGRHSIGTVTLKFLDWNGELTTKINTKLVGGESLRKKRIQLYKGFDIFTDWDDYSLRFTYVIDSVEVKDNLFTIKCADIKRITKANIFETHRGVLTSTVTAGASVIPVTISDAANKFPTIEHDARYSGNPSDTVGYIKIDDEIICHEGWTDGTFTSLQVVAGGRGALNTDPAEHTVTASEDDQKKKVDEFIYLEMAAPRLVYALLTGEIEGQTGGMPSHWNLGVPTKYVKLDDFTGIGRDLWRTSNNKGRMVRFQGLQKIDGKQFIEQELLSLINCFMPIYADGRYGLKQARSVLPYANYNRRIRDTQVVSHTNLLQDFSSVINAMVINWDWLPNLERFGKQTVLIDSDSISTHGEAPTKTFDFQGLFTGVHSDMDLQNYSRELRDRYSGPPYRISVTLLPRWERIEVGDTIRLSLPNVYDVYTDAPLDRVFEVQQARMDWMRDKYTFALFGGVQGAAQNALSSAAVMSDSFYTATGTELSTVLTISGGAVTASGTLTGGATMTVFYYDGDLTINSSVTVTITGNVELRIKGGLTINGDIDGVGNGLSGGASSANEQGNPGGNGELGNDHFSMGPAAVNASGSFVVVVSGNEFYYQTYDASITRLNLLNPDGLSLEGLPEDLRGWGGAAGDAAVSHPVGNGANTTVRANGGAGGDSGAGLLIISRSGGFGVSGGIDLSGTDGALGSTANYLGAILHAAPGVGGSGGGLIWLIDGNATLPSKSKVTINQGSTPQPSVDVEVPQNSFGVGVANGQSVAMEVEPRGDDQVDSNALFGYLPAAENGFVWMPADVEQEITGYENKPVGWSKVTDDDGNRPANNADVTLSNTAAAVVGQGALATLNTVGTTELATDAVTNAKIANDAVDRAQIADGAVNNARIADNIQITDAGVSTSTTGQRIVVNRSTNELEFYNSADDLICTIGIITGAPNDAILKVGGSTISNTPIWAQSNGSRAVWADNEGSTGYALYATGPRGVYASSNSSTRTHSAIECVVNTGNAMPFRITPFIANGAPSGTFANGQFCITDNGDILRVYLNGAWRTIFDAS